MSILDLLVSKQKLKLESLNKTYELNKFSLYHEAMLEEKYPDGISPNQASWSMKDYSNLIEILYSLLVDKSDFKAVEINDIDTDGNEVKRSIGGVELFKRCFTNLTEQAEAINVLFKVINNSRPEVKKKMK